MRTIPGVVGARWNEFDGIRAEDNEIADVLLPESEVPAVVRVGLRAIAELMAAERIFGGAGDFEVVRQCYAITAHAQFAQKATDTKQESAGIVAKNDDCRRGAAPIDRNMVTVDCIWSLFLAKLLRNGATDGDHGHRFRGQLCCYRPPHTSPFLDFVNKQINRLFLGARNGEVVYHDRL